MKLRWMIVWSYLYSDVHTNRLCVWFRRDHYAWKHRKEAK